MTELVVLVPVLKRPAKVQPLIDAFARTTPDHRLLFIADSDDDEEIQALKNAGAEWFTLDPPVNWARKVNAGYHATSEPFLFIGADDIEPTENWYEEAAACMTDDIGVVGTVDMCNRRTMRGQHSTHMLIRRAYIEEFSGVVDEPNTVVHTGYPHDFSDDELIQTAMARGMYAHAFQSVVQHLHPLVGRAPDDDTYRLGRSQVHVGRTLFESRKHLWEALQSVA